MDRKGILRKVILSVFPRFGEVLQGPRRGRLREYRNVKIGKYPNGFSMDLDELGGDYC
jgi:hypothetical protein